MRTCLYLRISTDKSGDGLGIERQREDCRKLAEQRGWTVVQEIVENNTSATMNAQKYRRLPNPNGCSSSGGLAAALPPYSSKP